MSPRVQISSDIEDHRDRHWRREATQQVESAFDAERFVERVGFAACLTIAAGRGRLSTSPSADAAMR
jgi:hypothetical protein